MSAGRTEWSSIHPSIGRNRPHLSNSNASVALHIILTALHRIASLIESVWARREEVIIHMMSVWIYIEGYDEMMRDAATSR